MTRQLFRPVLLAAAFVLGTYAIGWWAVPAIGAAWGWLARADRRPGTVAAFTAAAAWAALLLADARRGPLFPLARTLGAVMHLPGAALLLVTLLFAAALAGCAAATAAGIGSPGRPAAAR